MSTIDLVILGIVSEKPQSAYDIQKDIEYHHLSRWTKISVPSIYRKVLQLSEKGYLQSNIVKGDRFADKAVYLKRWRYAKTSRFPRDFPGTKNTNRSGRTGRRSTLPSPAEPCSS